MGSMTKRYDDSVEVQLAAPRGSGSTIPVAFRWRGHRYTVRSLLKRWREAGEGWDRARARDDEFFRVEAEGGVYDLRLDRIEGSDRGWRLTRVWD
ncbi:MAG: DUF6504 family protein [Actinomycetota bacterium]